MADWHPTAYRHTRRNPRQGRRPVGTEVTVCRFMEANRGKGAMLCRLRDGTKARQGYTIRRKLDLTENDTRINVTIYRHRCSKATTEGQKARHHLRLRTRLLVSVTSSHVPMFHCPWALPNGSITISIGQRLTLRHRQCHTIEPQFNTDVNLIIVKKSTPKNRIASASEASVPMRLICLLSSESAVVQALPFLTEHEIGLAFSAEITNISLTIISISKHLDDR